MPIGELQDMISLYLSMKGMADVVKTRNDRYIPVELR